MYVPIGNFFFLSEEESSNKSFSVKEFNRVVGALDILKDVEVSTSVQLHKMDNYMRIARMNSLFNTTYNNADGGTVTWEDGAYVPVPRGVELIRR